MEQEGWKHGAAGATRRWKKPILSHDSRSHEVGNPESRFLGRPRSLVKTRIGRDASPPPGLRRDLDWRFRLLKEKAGVRIPQEGLLLSEKSTQFDKVEELKRKKTNSKVKAGDETPQEALLSSKESTQPKIVEELKMKKTNFNVIWADHVGEPLVSCCTFDGTICLSTIDRDEGALKVSRGYGILKAYDYCARRTYKEALLHQPRRNHLSSTTIHRHLHPPFPSQAIRPVGRKMLPLPG